MAMTFERGSVGWNSTPPPTSRSFPSTADSVMSFQNPISPPPQANQRQFASGESSQKKKGKCFKCNKEGHWVNDCPMKSPKKTSPAADDFPIVHCLCGNPCVVKVSRTADNPGRKFYSCPLPIEKQCGFFKWCKESKDATSDVNIKTPMCKCSAGPCRIYTETNGQDVGRKFFVCPIKKGQGACSFSQPMVSVNNFSDERLLDSENDLLDEQAVHVAPDLLEDQLLNVTDDLCNESLSSPPSTLTSCGDTSPSSADLGEEGNSSHQGMEIESPVVDSPEHSRELEMNFELSRTSDVMPMVDSQGQEDTSDEPLRKHCKRLRHGDPKISSFVIESASDSWDMPLSKSTDLTTEKALRPSILNSGALIRRRQVKFLRQISSAGASSPVASFQSSFALRNSMELSTDCCLGDSAMSAISGILDLNFKGWYGRLVFPPSWSPTFPAPKPFFCGVVFPTFDPISLPRDGDVPFEIHSPSSAESSELSLLTPFQPLGALCEPSGLKPPAKKIEGNKMKGSVLGVFKQAAVSLQDELLTLLESMDYHDHASMLEESYSVFNALDRLFVDYEPFKEQVLNYIGCAASLNQIELSIDDDDRSSMEFYNSYNRKKLQLEDVSRLRSETSSAMEASNERLQYLQQEASRLKDMLLRAEEELALEKVEYMEIDTRFRQLAEDKMQLELNLQASLHEAEEAKKICQQREAKRNVAKASFDKAKSELRQSFLDVSSESCGIKLLHAL